MPSKNNYSKLFLAILLCFFAVQKNISAQETAKKEEEKKKYKGSLDAGANFANGNSKEQSIQANFNFDYKFNKETSNVFRSRADNKKQNDIRTREMYFVNNQTKKSISKSNFKFLEIEYVSDRYGGYNYRITETVGLGRKLLDGEKFKLTIQSSIGMRQIKLINSDDSTDKSNDFVVRAGSHLDAEINENVSLEENFDISTDQNATIIRSDTNLRILLSKKLYFKFGILIQRVSNVPVGRKNSDVTTGVKLGYEF